MRRGGGVKSMTRLFLVRHGENRANLTKEFSHRLVDYSLTPKGVLQARGTATYFLDKGVHHVFSSPLKRARETAEAIATATGAPLSVLESFREVDVGRLERELPTPENWLLHNDIVRGWWEGEHHSRFPEGESYEGLLERVREGYKEVLRDRDGQTLVIVAHGGSLTLPLKSLCNGVDVNTLRSAAHHNCAVSELDATLQNGEPHLTLVRWAACDHLSGEAAQFVAGTPAPGERMG